MNTLLKYVLIVLLAGHMPTVYTMKPTVYTTKPKPTKRTQPKVTVADIDDDAEFVVASSPTPAPEATTANSATATSSAAPAKSGTMVSTAKSASSATVTTSKNNKDNITHVASIANNKGDVMHLGVNADSISNTVNTLANATGSTITTLSKETEKALTVLAQATDTTMQVVNAGVDQLGDTGATAMIKVGNAMADAAGLAAASVVNQVTIGAYQVVDAVTGGLNGLDENGRQAVYTLGNTAQVLGDNIGKNATKVIQTAGTQVNRLAGQIHSTTRLVTQATVKSVEALTAAATPENIKALGGGQAAINFVEKTSASTTKFIDQGTGFLEQGTKLLEQGTQAAASLQTIAASAEKQAPTIMNGFANLLQSGANALNAAANAGNTIATGMSGKTTNFIAMGETYAGPLITEIVEETKLLALPTAQQFVQQTKMLQLAATAYNKDTRMSTTVAQVLKAAWTAHQQGQPVQAATLAQLRNIVIKKAKAPQQLLLTDGQPGTVTITDADDENAPITAGAPNNTAAPAPEPMAPEAAATALVAQLQTVLPQQQQPPQTAADTNNQQPQAPKTWSSLMVAPHPAFVFAACVAVAGIVVVSRKMYLKWKKNKEKKEKRKAHKASAQKEHVVEEAEVVL